MSIQRTPVSLPAAIQAESAWLRRLAVALAGDAAGAEDAVQETWMSALRHSPAEPGPTRPWLRVVLRNVLYRRAREQRRRLTRERAAEAGRQEESARAADDLFLRWEAQRRVADLVRELAEPYRTTLLLAYHEGLDSGAIARRLNLSAGTVRWRIKQGLDWIRAALDRQERASAPASGRGWRVLLAPPPIASAGRIQKALPIEEVMMAAKGTKTMLAVAGLLLAIGAGGWWLGRDRAPVTGGGGAPAVEERSRPAARARTASQPALARSGLGVYQKGARTPVPRFLATAPVTAADAGRPRGNPPRLATSGGPGPRNRFERTPADWPEIQRRLKSHLEAMETQAQRCLEAGFSADDPGLREGVMLGIDVDPTGLQDVWIGDRREVPSGPLTCFGNAVYQLDWSGLVPQPGTLTTYIHYQHDAGIP